MGNSTSSSAAASATPPPGGFGVRVSPGLLQAAGETSANLENARVQAAEAEGNELLQNAFRQGVEYAKEEFKKQQEAEAAAQREQQLAQMRATEDDKEKALHAAVEALQKRKYRAPVQPLLCKDERESVVQCYRAHRDGSKGDLVFACEKAVRTLDECSNAVRLAAQAKIVPGSLPG